MAISTAALVRSFSPAGIICGERFATYCCRDFVSNTCNRYKKNHINSIQKLSRKRRNVRLPCSSRNVGTEVLDMRRQLRNHIQYFHGQGGQGLSSHRKDDEQSRTIYETLMASIKLLEENSSPEPISSACHLLSFSLKNEFKWEDNGFAILQRLLDVNTSSSSFTSHPLAHKMICEEEFENFCDMLERRIQMEPLQYIIGQWDFHDIVLKTRPPLLCPRPETEELVEYAAKDIQQRIEFLRMQKSDRKVRVLDVGCGTGAIGIAIAHLFHGKDVEVHAIDISQAAVDLSNENARFVLGKAKRDEERVGQGQEQNHLEEGKDYNYKSIVCSAVNYTNTALEGEIMYDFGFDVVISNPPYIPSKDMETLTSDVVDFEDYGALCGGDDGLDVIRDILQRLPEWCEGVEKNNDDTSSSVCPMRLNPICWMEVDTSHFALIEELTKKEDAIDFIQGVKDFGGLDRFVQLAIIKK